MKYVTQKIAIKNSCVSVIFFCCSCQVTRYTIKTEKSSVVKQSHVFILEEGE